jgi:Ca-activated chloride channel family protein
MRKVQQILFLFITIIILFRSSTYAQQDIKLNVTVIDSSGHPVKDVSKEEFQILEDGVPQTISFFSKEEVPVSYCLAIDNSGSFTEEMVDKVAEIGKIIINGNKSTDETCLIRFINSDKIENIQDFTSDKKELFEMLDTLFVEPGQTAIIDAMYITIQHVAKYKKDEDAAYRRRAIILITDGDERNSYYKMSQMLELLRKVNVQIFVVGVAKGSKKTGGIQIPDKKAVAFLTSLAEETGGRAFFPGSLPELQGIAKDIMSYLHNQYIIGYGSMNKDRKNYRSVKVSITETAGRDKRIAITRSGYIPTSK